MRFEDCGSLWERKEFYELAKFGAKLGRTADYEYYDILSVTDGDVTYYASLSADTKVYRPDGKHILLKDVSSVLERTLFVPCKTRKGLLCADFFSKALVGYYKSYLDEVTIDQDADAVAIVEYLLQCPKFSHTFQVKDSKFTLYSAEVVHRKYYDAFVVLQLHTGSGPYEIPMLPEGGNLFQSADAAVIRKVKKLCDKEAGKVMNKIVEKICPHCGKIDKHDVNSEAYNNWLSGMRIQDAMPEANDFLREFLITGACYDCISKIFNRPKPGEDWGEMMGECSCCGCPVYAKDVGICPQCGENLENEEE